MKIHEYIVVGSGCSGAMAAQTLVEADRQVLMLDVGATEQGYAKLIPDKDFLTIRNTEPEQHKYFIGKNADGLVWSDIGKGAQITPPRKHIIGHTDTYHEIVSKTFSPLESLGYGGLGIGWGLQCWEYSDAEIKAAGMDPRTISKAYEVVAGRIGISGTKDEASHYTLGKLKTFQPSPAMDRNHEMIYQRYSAKRANWNDRGYYLGRTPLALITKPLKGRKPYAYKDMDYYSDNDRSAWRPWITVDWLRTKKNFAYQGGLLVTEFVEKEDYTEVLCLSVPEHKEKRFRCKKLVLGAGTLSSARIVLRSLGTPGQRLPLLCNPYTYIPCVQPKLFGKAAEPKKLGFAQLSLFFDKTKRNFDTSVASLYSYQSLMMFRTIRQLPLNFADGRRVLQYIMSGIVIMGVHHPDEQSEAKYVELVAHKKSPTNDALKAEYALSKQEAKRLAKREKGFVKQLRRAGTFALKRIDPGFGASIHYAGTIPYSKTEKPFTLAPSGRLHQTKSVFVADSSGFTYLPAKGLTFSLMANAHVVAQEALKDA